MPEHQNDTERESTGSYSRKRLLSISVIWLLAGTAVFMIGPSFGAQADPLGCDSAPCQFPGQANVGGITLAADFLYAEDLITYGVYPPSNTVVEELTPPGRAVDTETGARLGANDVRGTNFTIYKSWSYFDKRVGSNGDVVDVYIWADADEATLSGPSADCGNGDTTLQGSTQCDLIAGAVELSTQYLWASEDCSGNACGFINTPLDFSQLWITRPQDDACSALAAGLSGNVCFGLVDDDDSSGTINIIGGTTVTTGYVESSEYYHRTHNLRSVSGPNGNKQVNLKNPYFEMRYGVGEDRINVPTSEGSTSEWTGGNPPGSNNAEWASPIPQGSQPDAPYGDAALAVGFTCQGGYERTFCAAPAFSVNNNIGQGYDSIHRQPSRSLGKEHFNDSVQGGIRPKK